MSSSRGGHPSLPPTPTWAAHQQTQPQSQINYAQQQWPFQPHLQPNQAFYSSHSSHYAQAYSAQPTATYIPSPSTSFQPQIPTFSSYKPPPQQGSWYQPGSSRCTYSGGCDFTGSAKSVETHMMDRHLVYPKGWKEVKGWDADPSLRGCVPVPSFHAFYRSLPVSIPIPLLLPRFILPQCTK